MFNLTIPASFDVKNLYNSSFTPSTMHGGGTIANMMQRYLIQKAISRFEFEGIPDTWAKNYFLYSLFVYGFVSVIDTTKFGVIPQHCTLAGYNVFYQPSDVIIANPLIEDDGMKKIGVDASLIKLQPDYGSIWDIVQYYGNLMAQTIEAVSTNINNSKFAYVFMADDKTSAESFKKMFDQINEGQPAVFMDKGLFNENGDPAWLQFVQNLKQNYIAGDLLEDLKKIEAMFDTFIGIPNVNIAKASGVSDQEVNSNNEDTFSLCNLWLKTIRDGLKQTNDLFGVNVSVNLTKYEGGANNGITEHLGNV